MYTQEQRAKAVKLFIETGFNHTAVKSALGYPSRWSLDRWHADYLDKGYVKEKREHWEKFSDEEKAAAVAKYFELGRHLSDTVRELGYPSRSLLSQWVDELAPGMRKKTKPRKRCDDSERAGVVAGAYSGEGTVAEAVREADIDKVIFYNWRRKLLGEDAQGGTRKAQLSLTAPRCCVQFCNFWPGGSRQHALIPGSGCLRIVGSARFCPLARLSATPSPWFCRSKRNCCG